MLLHEAEEERGLLLAAQFEVEEMVSTAELYLRAKRLPVRLERRVGPGKALGGLSESEVVGSPGPDGLIGRPVLALSALTALSPSEFWIASVIVCLPLGDWFLRFIPRRSALACRAPAKGSLLRARRLRRPVWSPAHSGRWPRARPSPASRCRSRIRRWRR
jgi:hypothetical protein